MKSSFRRSGELKVIPNHAPLPLSVLLCSRQAPCNQKIGPQAETERVSSFYIYSPKMHNESHSYSQSFSTNNCDFKAGPAPRAQSFQRKSLRFAPQSLSTHRCNFRVSLDAWVQSFVRKGLGFVPSPLNKPPEFGENDSRSVRPPCNNRVQA